MMLSYRLRRFSRERGLFLLLLLIAFVGGFTLVYFGSDVLEGWVVADTQEKKIQDQQKLLDDPYDVSEYTPVELEVYGNGVLFRDDCQGLWIAMPYEKTFAIQRGKEGKLDIRPTQHDLMRDLFSVYNITMRYARLERMEHDLFYATVLLDNGGTLLQLDTRPSDALALATRFKTPIYVYTQLLRQQGRDVCDRRPVQQ